ncbi:hypothetical protein [Streptomyces sp. NRRL F-2664]|uniref:hypothetical protein n=1 Tax=Streptomyces sp. NRRL F-2664 TaxID=1463842 RepID=UPI0004CC8DC9|nr:hypothetical protein [Streptomyces sp. NRRL F-2664]
MLTLPLVAGGLTVIALAAVAFSYALRHGEEQDRQTRHTDPHATNWGRPDPGGPPAPERPANGRTRPRHRRPS